MRINFLAILAILVGYFVYLTYQPYLFDILIATLMALAFARINVLLYKYIKNRYLIVGINTFVLAVLFFGPFIYFVIEIGKYITHFDPHIIKIITIKAQKLLTYLPDFAAEKIKSYLQPEKITEIYNNILPVIGNLTAKSAFFVKDAFLIVVFFFFAILYGEKITIFLKKIIPLPENQLKLLFFNISEVMSVVLSSTIITALLEGVLFGFIVSFYGLDFFFFSIMYAFSSLIPIVGGIMMWGPVSLYLYSIGNTKGAIVVAIYSIIVISIIADTFVKPLIIAIIKKTFDSEIEINSLLIFFSIVAGLSSFGLWGIIIGPAVTTLFISILKFYEDYKEN